MQAIVAEMMERAALESQRRSTTESGTECGCSVAQYIEGCLDFKCVAMLVIMIYSALSLKLCRKH